MIEENRVGDSAVVVGDLCGADGDLAEELLFVLDADKLEPLLDAALDALTITANVTEELSEFAGFEDKFAKSFVTELCLALARLARDVSIKTDQDKVISCSCGSRCTEIAGVVAEEMAE